MVGEEKCAVGFINTMLKEDIKDRGYVGVNG